MPTDIADAEIHRQIQICERLKVTFVAAPADARIALSEPFDTESDVVQGLRRAATDKDAGWHIWTGNAEPDDIGFFNVMRVRDFAALSPAVAPYLGLAPGWRFSVGADTPKVWFDAAVL